MKAILTTLVTIFILLLSITVYSQTWKDGGGNISVGNIIYNHCTVCHRPGAVGAQASGHEWTSEGNCIAKASKIDSAVYVNRTMPPWMPDSAYKHFKGERFLSEAEISAIHSWANSGQPTGTGSTVVLPTFPSGAQLTGTQTAHLNHGSIDINTGAGDIYRNYAFKDTFTDDIYITKVEFIIPVDTHAAAVHHIALFKDESIDPNLPVRHESWSDEDMDIYPGYDGMSPGMIGMFKSSFIYSWVPGSGVLELPCNFGIVVKKGESFVAQFHYPKRQGGARPDTTKINIEYVFAASGVREAYSTVIIGGDATSTFTDTSGSNPTTDDVAALTLAPGANQWITRSAAMSDLPDIGSDNITVLGVMPHMHLRGSKTEMYTSNQILGGTHRKLLRISKWRFKWQEMFMLQTPVIVPNGESIYMKSFYDNNSATNKQVGSLDANTVTGGMYTEDEMMVGVIIWTKYQTDDEYMIMDPAYPGYVHADAGASVNGHACSVAAIGGGPTGSAGYGSLSYDWSSYDNGWFSGYNRTSSDANPYAQILTYDAHYVVTVTDGKGCKALDTALVTNFGTGFLKIFNGDRDSSRGRILGDIAVNQQGDVYCLGWFHKDIYLDRESVYINDQTPGDMENVFLARFSSDTCGDILSYISGGMDSIGLGYGKRGHPYSGHLALDASGNVYVSFQAWSGGTNTAFVTKNAADPSGGPTWVGTVDGLAVTDLESDTTGNIYMAGFNNTGGNISLDMHGSGTTTIPAGKDFIAKINGTDNGLYCDWVALPTWSASTDGVPSIKAEKDSASGTTYLFVNTNKKLAIYNTSGNSLASLSTIGNGSAMSQLTVNSQLKKIYTIDGDSLRVYNYVPGGSIIATPVNVWSVPGCAAIDGNRYTPYIYLSTKTHLHTRYWISSGNYGGLADYLMYVDPTPPTQMDKCLAVYKPGQRVYFGGDFPTTDTYTFYMNGISFGGGQGGSFLARSGLEGPNFAKHAQQDEETTPFIEAGEPVEGLKMFPNPAGTMLTIQTNYEEEGQLEIYNLLGMMVEQFTINTGPQQYDINTAAYAPGAYMVRIHKANGEILSKRFVKQ